METNTSAIALYRKLGFKQVDSGVVFRKEGDGRPLARGGCSTFVLSGTI